MLITTLSDTHMKHRKISLPKGDTIIHAGDITVNGREGEVISFLRWFAQLDYTYKIFIAGNHDFFFEEETEKYFSKIIPENIIYLNDSGATIEGLHIWGSPITPWMYDWAFNRERGKAIAKHWKLIPADTDILITHGPAYGVLDKNRMGYHTGCEQLIKTIKKIKPKVHICGHIHEAYGQTVIDGTRFINACVLNENDEVAHEAISFTVDSLPLNKKNRINSCAICFHGTLCEFCVQKRGTKNTKGAERTQRNIRLIDIYSQKKFNNDIFCRRTVLLLSR
jgi:Icc-related predicted phosphoesterase